MPDYGSALYWQERYAHDPTGAFDWYVTWDELRPALAPLLAHVPMRDCEIFVPGCGSSTLSARLYADGYHNVSNVDVSSVVVSQMRDRYAEMPEMDWSVMDATDMRKELPDECFDIVIDKALLDSLLCGEDAFRRAVAAVSEFYRVLKPRGAYVCVSYAAPPARTGYFTSTPAHAWTPEVFTVPKPPLDGFKETAKAQSEDVYYVYVCRKPA